MIAPEIANADVTRHILKTFGLRASKRLGQNFLVDGAVVRAIVEAAEIVPGDRVLEIGPGIGTLTQGLAEAGADVTAVELDKKLPAVLAQTLDAYPHVRIVPGDILKTDIPALMGKDSFKVVANLPYYITTPILLALLEAHLPISHLVTMVQKEVADRMVARPGSKTYGALSVAVQYHMAPEIVRSVAPRSFIPAPEVSSAVIACKKHGTPPVSVSDERMFFRVVRASFGQRRKTLFNALSGVGVPKEAVRQALAAAGIDGQRRGETRSLAEFALLADAFSGQEKQGEGKP